MPDLAPRPCIVPGCKELSRAKSGECDKHRGHRVRKDQRTRGTAAQRGYGARHRRWRRLVLSKHPWCVECKAQGELVVATVADHVVPLNHGGDWKLSNGQGLCSACHQRKTNRERWG